MQTFRTIKLIWTFYRSFLLVSIVINLFCLRIFWNAGYGGFSGLFWLKTTSLAISYYFVDSYKKREYYYYHNLGISRLLLWVVTLGFDFAFFIFLIILTNLFK